MKCTNAGRRTERTEDYDVESRRFGGSKPAIKDTAFLPGPDALRPVDLRESSVEAEARKSIERNTALPSEKFRRDTISLLRMNEPTGRTLTHSRSALPPPLCPPLRPPCNAISPSGTSAFQVKLPLAVLLPRRCEITRGTRTRDSILAALFPLPRPFLAHPRYRSRVFDYLAGRVSRGRRATVPGRKTVLHDVFNGTTRNFSR